MYKVLIADDEQPILQGLCTLIDWQALGFTVCAAVPGGALALQRIRELQPELVLMDLRMPDMDGMAVIEAARHEGFTGYFIILSGATDFAYAQRAIRSRTSFYLTKPIDEDELADAVRSIARELDAHIHQHTQAVQHGRSSLLFRLLTGIYDPAAGSLADYGLAADRYQVIACEDFDLTIGQQRTQLLSLLRSLGLALSAGDVARIDNREFALLCGGDRLELFARALQARRAQNLPPQGWQDAFVCLGRSVQDPRDVVLSYCDATKLMQRRFFLPPDRHVADGRDLPHEKTRQAPAVAQTGRLLTDCIQAQNLPRLRQQMAALREALAEGDRSVSSVKLLLAELYMTVRSQLAALYRSDLADFAAEAPTVRSIEEAANLQQAIGLLQTQFESFADKLCSRSSEDVIARICQYIEHNCGRTLRLEELSGLFGYNSSYLGKLFREKTRCSFNEYLDKVRIEHAKAMLSASNQKVYEIAEQLGYKDVDYFHKKFKKYVGVSPNEYRRTYAQPPKW